MCNGFQSGGTLDSMGEMVNDYSCAAVIHILADDPMNEEAWILFWEQERASCFGIAFSILRSVVCADDALQNAFMYIKDHAGDFNPSLARNPDAACRGWVHRIIVNSALSLQRSEQRLARRNQDHGNDMHQQQCVDPLTQIEQHDLIEAINTQVEQLPSSQRTVLAVYFGAEMDYKTVASALECTVNNARVRVHRALKSLSKKLLRAGIHCSVLGITNALIAEEIPIHQSSIDVTDIINSSVLPSSLDLSLLQKEPLGMTKIFLTVLIPFLILLSGALGYYYGSNSSDQVQQNHADRNDSVQAQHVQFGSKDMQITQLNAQIGVFLSVGDNLDAKDFVLKQSAQALAVGFRADMFKGQEMDEMEDSWTDGPDDKAWKYGISTVMPAKIRKALDAYCADKDLNFYNHSVYQQEKKGVRLMVMVRDKDVQNSVRSARSEVTDLSKLGVEISVFDKSNESFVYFAMKAASYLESIEPDGAN